MTLALHVYIWAGIGIMMFCRVRKTNAQSRSAVRWSLSGVSAIAFAYAAAPWIPDWQFEVRTIDTLLGGALFALFAAFERSWRNGPPDGISSTSYASRSDRAAIADSRNRNR